VFAAMAAASFSLFASTSRAVSRLVLLGAVPIIAVLVGVAWLIAAPLARRLQRPRWQLFVCLATTAPIPAVTVLREGFPQGFARDLGWMFSWWLHGWGKVANDLATYSEAKLNVVLFVPAGVTWAATTRRYGRTLVALAVGSFVIETLQALFGLGAADTTDLVTNTLGAAIGVGLAMIGAAVWRRTKWSTLGPAIPRLSLRARVAVAAAVVTAAMAAVLFVQWRADGARDDLLAEVHRTYDDSTIDDMAPYFFDEGKPFEEFMERNSVRPDSFRYARDHAAAEVRYSVLYFGLSRCVFVTWTGGGVSFRTDEGDICTDYLGDRLD
jgi:hypothetical protein